MNISERLAHYAARASYDKGDLLGSIKNMHEKANQLEKDADWLNPDHRRSLQASIYLRKIAFRLWMMYGKKVIR